MDQQIIYIHLSPMIWKLPIPALNHTDSWHSLGIPGKWEMALDLQGGSPYSPHLSPKKVVSKIFRDQTPSDWIAGATVIRGHRG
jgi:hypothetical protein